MAVKQLYYYYYCYYRVLFKCRGIKKKLLEHFTEVTIVNDNVTRGNLFIGKFLDVT